LDGPAPPMSIAVVPSATDGRDWQPAYLTRAVNVWEDGIHARLLFDNVEKVLDLHGISFQRKLSHKFACIWGKVVVVHGRRSSMFAESSKF